MRGAPSDAPAHSHTPRPCLTPAMAHAHARTHLQPRRLRAVTVRQHPKRAALKWTALLAQYLGHLERACIDRAQRDVHLPRQAQVQAHVHVVACECGGAWSHHHRTVACACPRPHGRMWIVRACPGPYGRTCIRYGHACGNMCARTWYLSANSYSAESSGLMMCPISLIRPHSSIAPTPGVGSATRGLPRLKLLAVPRIAGPTSCR